MSDKREDGKNPDAGQTTPAPQPAERQPSPVTRRDAFKRIAKAVVGGAVIAAAGPLVPREAKAIYYSHYFSYSSRSYFSYSSRSYMSYSSRSYMSYSSRYNSRYNSAYSSRYNSSYNSRYNSYSSHYNSVSKQQQWQREDRYRSQQNQVVKDSINKQVEQERKNRYVSTAYTSRAAYTSRYLSTAYTSRAGYNSRYVSTAYTSRFAPAYTSHAPGVRYQSTAYTSRAPAYTSHAVAPAHQKTPPAHQKTPEKAKHPYSSWYCSQGFWHRYSSMA